MRAVDEVFGRYRLVEVIGEGGMGNVFRAHDTVMGRDVAIKVLPEEIGGLPGYRERFRREALVAARLTEPHIVPIHDAGEIDGRLYLVMPIIEGVDLETVLKREGPLSPQLAVRVIQQLAVALNAAHKHGLVHRDIKPSNALMTSDKFVYLIDFGIAHYASATKLTQTGSVIGSFAYMAPERFRDGTADARADVYSLACVLYECLTGTPPYPGTMEQQIAGHLHLDPPKPSSLNPAIPAGFDEVIARAMAKNPEERYQTATELAAAAQHALSGAPVETRPAATLIDDRGSSPTARWQPPTPAGPIDPTLAAPQQPGAGQPYGNRPDQARQQPATPWAPPPARSSQTPAASQTISVGRFACLLCGIVLVSISMAYCLVPEPHGPRPRFLSWLIVLGTIPGIVFLVRGQGRAYADRTITGCALVTLGLTSLLLALHAIPRVIIPYNPITASIYPDAITRLVFFPSLAVIGLPLVLIALRRSSPAVARGCLLCGIAFVGLALLDLVLRLTGRVWFETSTLLIGAATGLTLLVAGVTVRRRLTSTDQPR